MASSKNTNRSKRKYGDKRKSVTISNKSKKPSRHERTIERLSLRTQELIGQKVRIRTKDGPEIGVVQDVIAQPQEAKRKGQYLHVVTPTGQFDRARSRAKIISSTPSGDIN